jgi:hypothetical protein
MSAVGANSTFRAIRVNRRVEWKLVYGGFLGSRLRCSISSGISRRCSWKSLEFVPGKSAPCLSGLPDFRRPADKLCEAVRTT